MKIIGISVLLGAALIAGVIVFFSPTREPTAEWNSYTPGKMVSLVALIANPERYEGKKVQVIGYVVLEFEGNAVYLHEEDNKEGLRSNGLWLSLGPRGLVQNPSLQPGYAIVAGVFRGEMHGHLGLWSGSLTDLTRLEFLPRQKPNQAIEPTPASGRGSP